MKTKGNQTKQNNDLKRFEDLGIHQRAWSSPGAWDRTSSRAGGTAPEAKPIRCQSLSSLSYCTWTKRTAQTHRRLFRCHLTFLCPLWERAKTVRNALTSLLYSRKWVPSRTVNPLRALTVWEPHFIRYLFFYFLESPSLVVKW